MTGRLHHNGVRCWCGIFHMDGTERSANVHDGLVPAPDGRVILGTQADRAALMLADRRHRPSCGREVCQHCDESWPCDARRALDVLNRVIEAGDALDEHARLDCAALGRVWRVIAGWSTSADAAEVDGDPVVILAALRMATARIRRAIEDDPPGTCPRCRRTGATLDPVPSCSCTVRCTHTQCGVTTDAT